MQITILDELIRNVAQYDAHIQEKNNEIVKRETLSEHTDLTIQYFERIWDEKGLNEMVGRFSRKISLDLSPEAQSFLNELILGVPLFHDFGKINPAFQQKKMNNIVNEKAVFACVGMRHSLISAVVYIDYFLEQLKIHVKEKSEKKRLRMLILFHAYVIARHHSDLNDYRNFTNSLESGNGMDIVRVLSGGKCPAIKTHFSLNEKSIKSLLWESEKQRNQIVEKEAGIAIYAYVKMIYSVLVASDFYATSEFMSGTKLKGFGNLEDISKWQNIYENTELMQKVRKYQKEKYPKSEKGLQTTKDINELRTEILSDAELLLKENEKERIFYLEAPTGSGKSNIAIDLCFQMMRADARLNKIYYIYPFNTLVEQNQQNMRKIFKGEEEVMHSIAVVNSLTPIKETQKQKEDEEKTEQTMFYQKALLDRQFLNYPMIISTHVSLFDTMFGDTKESAFGFHQLMNSVIVLDEIQSYKNKIWGEIIWFLKEFSELLNIKILIMSATLPNLDLLSQGACQAVQLLQNKDKYFLNPRFKERVQILYELLESEISEDILFEHVCKSMESKKKILVEFIKKDTAASFFKRLSDSADITCDVEYMSGDDSPIERTRILDKIENSSKAIILVATQVIEAGVDIDMDIGYKNISKLDSEEQFLGRINRSKGETGIVYFFKLDDGKRIYGEDVRIAKEFTLEQEDIREFLIDKDFDKYYERILTVIENNYNKQVGPGGLQSFFEEEVGKLHWPQVKQRMQLIAEDSWSMSVYLSRILVDNEGFEIDGSELWRRYMELLQDCHMDYAEKKVKLSEVTSRMNYFIYQIKKNDNLTYNDRIGEIFFIEDGERFFENGKLNRKKIQGELGDFVDFI